MVSGHQQISTQETPGASHPRAKGKESPFLLNSSQERPFFPNLLAPFFLFPERYCQNITNWFLETICQALSPFPENRPDTCGLLVFKETSALVLKVWVCSGAGSFKLQAVQSGTAPQEVFGEPLTEQTSKAMTIHVRTNEGPLVSS